MDVSIPMPTWASQIELFKKRTKQNINLCVEVDLGRVEGGMECEYCQNVFMHVSNSQRINLNTVMV